MNTSNEKEQGRGAGQLLLLMAAFGLPMVGAWFLYFNPDLLPGGRSNRGELVQPVHPISDQVFSTRDGATFSSAELKGYWTLMLSAGESCAEPCRKRIYDMLQIRKAMAENYGEIKRVVLFTTPSPSMETDADLTFSGFMKAFEGTTVIVGDSQSVSALRAQFVPAGDGSVGHLYLVDPMGNLMMHYLPQQPAADVLSDMELLLKVNKWGGGH
jgi:cytochrome oxidase Cu insertion factor (SCO1/SenC/PrrC family)